MITFLTSIAPIIVSIIMAVLKVIGISKENKVKFLQSVLNNSNENISIKLREEYSDLLNSHDKPQDGDVF